MSVKIAVEFSGGAELLFGKVKRHSLELEESDAKGGKWTIRLLIAWIRDNLLKERPELFVQVCLCITFAHAVMHSPLSVVCLQLQGR